MWHLEKAILVQFNTSENVSCLSLDDANTLRQSCLFRPSHCSGSEEIRMRIFSQVYRLYWFLLYVAVPMRRLSVNRNESVKKRPEKNIEQDRTCVWRVLMYPLKILFFSTRVFLCSQLTNGKTKKKQQQQRQQWIDWSRSFLASSAEVGKMSAGSEKTESGVWSGCARLHLFYFVGSGLSTALLLYVEMGLPLL